jgi:hypothetical protein
LSQAGWRERYCCYWKPGEVCGDVVGWLLSVEGREEGVSEWFESGVRGGSENSETYSSRLRHYEMEVG